MDRFVPDPHVMRSDIQINPGFVAGIGLGLALAAVTALTIGAARRIRTRRELAEEHMPVIDGVHAPDGPSLDARPAEEANALEIPRLESEAIDVSPMSQRW